MSSPESAFLLDINANDLVWYEFIDPNCFDPSAVYPLPDALVDTDNNRASLSCPSLNDEAEVTSTQLFPSNMPQKMPPNVSAQYFQRTALNVLDPVRPETESCWSVDQQDFAVLKQGAVPEPTGLSWAGSSESEASSPCPSQSAPKSYNGRSRSSLRWTSSSPASTSVIKREQKQQSRARGRKWRNSTCSESREADLKAKAAHSAVERRYRDKLNEKMMQLHCTLIASESSRTLGKPAERVDHSSLSSGKVCKAEIMSNAINYVYQTEVEMRHMTNEIEQLQNRLRHLETPVGCEDYTLRRSLVATC